jgi:hypothetical protein
MLNTAANMGGTWPGFFVLRGVDYFTIAHCQVQDKLTNTLLKGISRALLLADTAYSFYQQSTSVSVKPASMSAKLPPDNAL